MLALALRPNFLGLTLAMQPVALALALPPKVLLGLGFALELETYALLQFSSTAVRKFSAEDNKPLYNGLLRATAYVL